MCNGLMLARDTGNKHSFSNSPKSPMGLLGNFMEGILGSILKVIS